MKMYVVRERGSIPQFVVHLIMSKMMMMLVMMMKKKDNNNNLFLENSQGFLKRGIVLPFAAVLSSPVCASLNKCNLSDLFFSFLSSNQS